MKFFEAERKYGSRGFGCIPTSPMFLCQSPADLDARWKMRLKRWNRKTDKPGKTIGFCNLNGPQAKTLLVEVSTNSHCQSVAFFTRQRRRKKLHDGRIGIHVGKWNQILRPPAAQQ